ncbi:MAG: ABC transporter permease [Propionibacteriaceae bacterium]
MTAVTAAGYGMWPISSGFEGNRRFFVATFSPLNAIQVAVGEACSILIRLAFQIFGFIIVAVIMRALNCEAGLFRLFMSASATCLFMYLLFASLTVWLRKFKFFFFVADRIILVPLMMLSGTWCDLSVLPDWIRKCAQLSPIWHGAQLSRATNITEHLAFLLCGSIAFFVIFIFGMKRRLEN